MRLSYDWEDEIGPVIRLHTSHRVVGLCFCHRRKDRSVPFFGLEKYLCARCIGLVIGLPAGILTFLLSGGLNITLSVGLMLPLLLDGFSQAMGYRESNNILRLTSGFIFSIGFITAMSGIMHLFFELQACV